MDTFGDEVIAKYGSYANIGKDMIEVILQWMWNKTFNKPIMGDSGALCNLTLGTENEVVAVVEKKRGRGRPRKKILYLYQSIILLQ